MSKFVVKLNKLGQGLILCDGKDLSNSCNGIYINANVGKRPSINVFLNGEVDIEGEGDIYLKLPDNREFKVKEI